MVTLRFIAREDALATVPGSRPSIGQAAFYIGRKYVPPDRTTGKGARYEATEEPFEVTFDLDKQEDAGRFNRYIKIAQRGDIWPADEETAEACGVDFVPTTFSNGEWKRTSTEPTAPGNSPAAAPGNTPAPEIPLDTTALENLSGQVDVDLTTSAPMPPDSKFGGQRREETPFGLPPQAPQDVIAEPAQPAPFADIELPREKPTKKRF